LLRYNGLLLGARDYVHPIIRPDPSAALGSAWPMLHPASGECP
jgi:hypothetical protein